ncbi:hypothetical protein ACRALDRAFT_2136609, partial [Sodiomyces alcalophilus JCM 7366]|uniref:uncharacterized protein n=1 Tax=Sodiomyces alcalophilus JCM 7366 TaxID=591952 RepID=UPI0039B4479E
LITFSRWHSFTFNRREYPSLRVETVETLLGPLLLIGRRNSLVQPNVQSASPFEYVVLKVILFVLGPTPSRFPTKEKAGATCRCQVTIPQHPQHPHPPLHLVGKRGLSTRIREQISCESAYLSLCADCLFPPSVLNLAHSPPPPPPPPSRPFFLVSSFPRFQPPFPLYDSRCIVRRRRILTYTLITCISVFLSLVSCVRFLVPCSFQGNTRPDPTLLIVCPPLSHFSSISLPFNVRTGKGKSVGVRRIRKIERRQDEEERNG